MKQTPFSKGFRMPAEWEPHESTWTCWPFDDELWAGELAGVRDEFAEFISTILLHEDVNLLVNDKESYENAKTLIGEHLLNRKSNNIRFFQCPIDDVWFRDSGPLFVTRATLAGRQVLPTKWEFNSWGRKFFWEKDNQAALTVLSELKIEPFAVPVVMEGGSLEQDGTGYAITTEQCLLSKERNPILESRDIELHLRETLGIEHLCWLKGGLEGDHTDGHIDTFARFVDTKTVLCHSCSDPTDVNFHTMLDNKHTLESFSQKRHLGWKVIDLPLPRVRAERDGERLPFTYANYYVFNGAVIVPQFNDPEDAPALKLIESFFKGRKVYGIPASKLMTGGGSFHCVTQQQPAGQLVSWKDVL